MFLAIGLLIGLGLLYGPFDQESLLSEYGYFETVQFVILIILAISWALPIIDAKFWSLKLWLSSFALAMAAREITWLKVYGIDVSISLTLQYIHVTIMLILLACLSIYWARKPVRQSQLFRSFLKTRAGGLIAWGVTVIIFSDIFEKQFMNLETNEFWEEWIELMGYSILLLSVWYPYFKPKQF